MIILLEGPDGAGKSTLYERLQHDFDGEFIKGIWYTRANQYDWWKAHMTSDTVYFIDRGFISELVYRPIKRDRKANISLREIGSLCTDDLFVVYCTNKNAYDKMLERGDNYITSSAEHESITVRYTEVMNTIEMFTNSQIFNYDYEYTDYNTLLNAIKAFINKGGNNAV